MTERIDVKITADGSGLVRAGKEAEKAVKQLGDTVKSQGAATRNAFSGLSGEASRLGTALSGISNKFSASGIIGEFGKARSSLRGIEEEARRVGAALTKALSPKAKIPAIPTTTTGAAGAGAAGVPSATGAAGVGIAAGLGAGLGAAGVVDSLKAQRDAQIAVVVSTKAYEDALQNAQLAQKNAQDAAEAAEASYQSGLKTLEAMQDNNKALTAQIQELKKAQEEAAEAERRANQVREETNLAYSILSDQISEIEDRLKLLADQEEKLLDSITRTGDASGVQRQALEAVNQEAQSLTDKYGALTKSIDSMDNKLEKAVEEAERAAAAHAEQAQKALALDAVQEDLDKTYEKAKASLKEQEAGLTGYGKALADAKAAVSSAKGELEKANQGLTDATKRVEEQKQSLQSLSENWRVVTTAVALAGAALYKVAEDMSSDERAIAKLTGAFADARQELGPMITLANQLGQTSFFDPEAVYEAQAVLHNLGATKQQMEVLLPAALKFAAVYGTTASDAARKLADGMQNSTKGLRDFGIALPATAGEGERYAAVMKRAAAASEEFDMLSSGMTGRLAGIKKSFDDLLGTIGTQFGDQLKIIVGLTELAIRALTSLVGVAKVVAQAVSNAFTQPFAIATAAINGLRTGGFEGMRTASKAAADYFADEMDKAIKGMMDGFSTFGTEAKRILKEIYAGQKPKQIPQTTKPYKEEKKGLIPLKEEKVGKDTTFDDFLERLRQRVANAFEEKGLNQIALDMGVFQIADLGKLKQATDILGERFVVIAAEAEQFKLDKAKQEAENTAFALKQAKETAQQFEDGLKKAADELDKFADSMAQVINTVTEAAGSLARGDIRGAVGTGISAIGEFGGSIGKVVSAIFGAVQTAFVIGDEHQQANLEREAANQELFRANLEKFGISVETMGDTQKDLAVKLGLKTQGAADIEKARSKAAGTLQAGGLGDIAGLAATLTEAQATEVAKLVANGDLEGAATMLYGLAGKTRPEGYYRPYVSPAMAEAGVYVPDMPTGVAAPLSQTQQATLVTALNTLIDAIRPPGGATDGVAAPAQVQGTDPRNPVYVFDVTPAEEQFMFAPRSYFFRAAAEARAVM